MSGLAGIMSSTFLTAVLKPMKPHLKWPNNIMLKKGEYKDKKFISRYRSYHGNTAKKFCRNRSSALYAI
ncbi:hypothetical protein ACEQPO_07110 [Bacillus sp. SL00103]